MAVPPPSGPQGATTRITRDISTDPDDWKLNRDPSLGKPTRTIITDDRGTPIREEWRFKVALGGKKDEAWGPERTFMVDGKYVDKREVRELVLTFKIKKGEKPSEADERALMAKATIGDMRSKISRLPLSDARNLYNDIKRGDISKIHIISLRANKKSPITGVCLVWPGKDGELFALFHDHKLHASYQKTFANSNIKAIEADLAEMFQTGKEVERPGWMPWLRGQKHAEGKLIRRFSAVHNEEKLKSLRGKDAYKSEKMAKREHQTVGERIEAMPVHDEETMTESAYIAARATAVAAAALPLVARGTGEGAGAGDAGGSA